MNTQNKVLITIVFLIIFYNLNAHVYNRRTGVAIYSEVDKETFPERWKGSQTAVKGISQDTIAIKRSILDIGKALDKYPKKLIENNLTEVYMLKKLEMNGLVIGGTAYTDKIYIADDAQKYGYSESYIEKTFHHEFSHILFERYWRFFKSEKWNSINTIPYGKGGSQAVKDLKDSLYFKPELNSMGFLCQYSTSAIKEDFSEIAENIFYPTDEFYDVVKKYPKINQKLELVYEFYFAVDKYFSREYFEQLYENSKKK